MLQTVAKISFHKYQHNLHLAIKIAMRKRDRKVWSPKKPFPQELFHCNVVFIVVDNICMQLHMLEHPLSYHMIIINFSGKEGDISGWNNLASHYADRHHSYWDPDLKIDVYRSGRY